MDSVCIHDVEPLLCPRCFEILQIVASFPVGAEGFDCEPGETSHTHMARVEELLMARGLLPPPHTPSPEGTPEVDAQPSGPPQLRLVEGSPDVHSAEGPTGQRGSPVRHCHDSSRVGGASVNGSASDLQIPRSAEKGAESA